MSADSQQIDITPYKVRRENVITSSQSKVSESKPTDDLASSILNKLTEIRGNLYPTHLNIPPHKSGPLPTATSPGYSYVSASLTQPETGTLASGIDTLLKKDVHDYTSELSPSRDHSPSALSSTSSFDPSYSNKFETGTFKNTENSFKSTENATIPRIELNFAASNNYLGYLEPPSANSKPAIQISGANVRPATETEFSPQAANSHLNKNAFHISSGYEPQKNSLDSTYAHSRLHISNNPQEQTSSSNQMYIPIVRNSSLSPDSTLNNIEPKSTPTSTRATQTKVHISATARLPSAGKPASRAQLINSLNEALKLGHGDNTTMTSEVNESTKHRRQEKSMDLPKNSAINVQVGGPKASTKQKNKSTVILANIIAQNQGMESKRFSFGQLNSSVSQPSQRSVQQSQQSERSVKHSDENVPQSERSVQQSERSEYSQRDKEIQDYINSVSKNQTIRAEALKKRAQNPASSTTLETRLQQVIQEREKNQSNGSKIFIDDQLKSKGTQSQSQRDVNQAFPVENQATEVTTAQNKFQRESRKTLSLENPSKQLVNQVERPKRKTLPQNNDVEEFTSLHQSQRNVNFPDSEEHSPLSISKSRASPFEDESTQTRVGRDKIIAKPHLEGMQYENKSKQALQSDYQSERTKSHTATRSQLEDDIGLTSVRNESQIGKTRSRPMTRTQFDNLPYEDSSSQIAIHNENQSERTKSRPMTRSQLELDDETRDSGGHEPFQRNMGAGSGSTSPARSHTTEIIVAKKLEYSNQQQNRNVESPIRVREINAHSGRGSVIEKSYSESPERSTEKKKMAINAESLVVPSRPAIGSIANISDRNQARTSFRAGRENQGRNVDSNDENETRNPDSNSQTGKRVNMNQNQNYNSANSNTNFVQKSQRSQEMMNFSPVRQNLGMMASPQANSLNMRQNNMQIPTDFRMQMPPSFNMQLQIPTLENDPYHAEHQKHIMMIMNYYENHLNNMKNAVFQQNETLNQERYKTQMAEKKNMEMAKTIQSLEQTIKDQSVTLESTQRELKTRYEVVMDELASLKRTMLTHQIVENPVMLQKVYQPEGKEYQSLLYHEVLSLRKDMENQRSIMHDFRSSTRHLEDQMRDIEKMYVDELRNNSAIKNKQDLLRENLDTFKKDYLKVDTLNQILVDGYERTRKDLDSMRGQENTEEAGHSRGRNVTISEFQQTQQIPRRDIYIGSPSPSKYENNQEMMRNKMRAENSEMKNLLQWNSKNEANNVHFISHSYTPSTKGPQTTSNAQQPQQFFFQNGYNERRGYSPQQQQQQSQGIMKKIPITEQKANRSHVVFPSYQKIESHRDQIKRIDQTIAELGQHKKLVENELFKMPSVAKSLEQKRKKAGLEMELEGVENQIEECKNQLRKYDVLNVK